MSMNIEEHVPVVKYHGLNTDKAVDLDSTLNVAGATTLQSTLACGAITSTGGLSGTTLTATGLVKVTNPVLQQTITNIDAQNAAPTIAQILGGIVIHTSVTGGGTVTVPTGTAMSAGVSGVAVGSTIKWTYYNDGNQTATITAADGHTLVGGTAAVTTGKHIYITSYCSAANTWVSFLTTLM